VRWNTPAAAYNAGEDRIAAWKAERNYDEIPELVESIPFTNTRICASRLRNTEVYRMIYGHRAWLRRPPLATPVDGLSFYRDISCKGAACAPLRTRFHRSEKCNDRSRPLDGTNLPPHASAKAEQFTESVIGK